MTLEAIKYRQGSLDILDQLLLPTQSVYITINDTEDAWQAIKKMQVMMVVLNCDLYILIKIFINTCGI